MPDELTRARRLHHKATTDRTVIDAILDAMPVAHVGHLVDGHPVVTPTLQWRDGDRVFWHGSSASRMIRRAGGAKVCLTVTLTDGMVLARSGLEHSVNYRSVMVFGEAVAVQGPQAKTAALKSMMDRLFPGRWDALRPMTAQELKATAILSLPLTRATAKIGQGFPTDAPEDVAWRVWAGILPISLTIGAPEPAPDLSPALNMPDHVRNYRIGEGPTGGV